MYDKDQPGQEYDREALQKTARNTILFTVFLFLFIIIWSLLYKEILSGHATDLYELGTSLEDVPGRRYISLEVDAVLANYAEATTRRFLLLTSTDQYYTILLKNGDMISLKVHDKEQIRQLDEIQAETVRYLNAVSKGDKDASLTKTVALKGSFSTMDEKVSGFYDQALLQMGISPSEPTVHHVELDTTNGRTGFVICLVIMVLVLAVSTLASFAFLKNWRAWRP